LTYGMQRLTNFAARKLRRSRSRSPTANTDVSRGLSAEAQADAARAAKAAPPAPDAPVAPLVRVGAVIGRPHPGSDAELMLYRRLTADPELSPLFSYNQQVTTTLGQQPRIDVLWVEGRLAIEIDGHPDHARAGKFCQDRERDYQLLISGYRVLRIAEMHVLTDPELIVSRIREAVRFVKQENHGHR